jgi:hypothetical protein
MDNPIINANFTSNTRMVQLQHLNLLQESETEVVKKIAPTLEARLKKLASCIVNLEEDTKTILKDWLQVYGHELASVGTNTRFTPELIMLYNGTFSETGIRRIKNPFPITVDIVLDKSVRYISCDGMLYEVPIEMELEET